jgi:hypothetical protein
MKTISENWRLSFSFSSLGAAGRGTHYGWLHASEEEGGGKWYCGQEVHVRKSDRALIASMN